MVILRVSADVASCWAYFFCVLACSAAEEKHSAADLLPVTTLRPICGDGP